MRQISWVFLLLIGTTVAAQPAAQRTSRHRGDAPVESNLNQATWIWYPGDFEIWLGNSMQNRRTERGTFFPPFWKLDNHYVLMDFHKDVQLEAPEQVSLFIEGDYNVKIDGKPFEGAPRQITVPVGKHRINIKVFNRDKVPAIYVKGKSIVSDSSWLLTYEDKEWIDETGKVSDQSGTKWLQAGYWNFNDPAQPPSTFKLARQPQSAVNVSKNGSTLMVDFGKETFGFIKLHGLQGKGKLSLYYGESKEEAWSTASCETLDRLELNTNTKIDSIMPLSKAFRFVHVESEGGVKLDSVSMLYEYLPVENRGTFSCSDSQA